MSDTLNCIKKKLSSLSEEELNILCELIKTEKNIRTIEKILADKYRGAIQDAK